MRAAPAVLGACLLAGAGGVAWWWSRRPAKALYTVVRGDTLTVIARRYGVTVAELRSWNGIRGDRIEVGQVLVIGAAGPARHPRRRRTHRERRPAGRPQELPMPEPEPCLAFDADPGEQGIVAPAGLSHAQAKAALDAILPEALRCRPEDGSSGPWDMVFELTVGCDGVVDRVELRDPGSAPPELASCVAGVIRHADFPAHDVAQGFSFDYPVRME